MSGGGQANVACDIPTTRTSVMPLPMMVWPPSPETSSHLWVPRCPALRWSGHCRLRLLRNSGLGDALISGGPSTFACGIPATLTSEMPCPMVVQPLSPETSSHLWVPRCFALRWSGPFRLRHPRVIYTTRDPILVLDWCYIMPYPLCGYGVSV